MEIKKIVFIGIFASVYVALTALNPIGYGPIQFRVSEFMLILPFWDKKYISPSILGVFIANMFSPLGLIDVFVGLSIAFITYFIFMNITKNKKILILLYSLLCGLVVSFALVFVYNVPFVITFVSITISQMIIGFGSYPLNNRISLLLKSKV